MEPVRRVVSRGGIRRGRRAGVSGERRRRRVERGRFSRSLERRGRGWAARVAGAAGAASVARDHSFRVASLGGGVLHRGGAPVGLRRRPGRAVRVRVRARGADAVPGGVPPAVREPEHGTVRDGRRRVRVRRARRDRLRSLRVGRRGRGGGRLGDPIRRPDRRLAPIARDVRIVRALVSRSRPDDRRRVAVRAGGERPRDRRRRVRQRRARDAHRVSVHDARRVGAGDVPGHGLGRRPRRPVFRLARVLRAVLRRDAVPGGVEDEVREGAEPVQPREGKNNRGPRNARTKRFG